MTSQTFIQPVKPNLKFEKLNPYVYLYAPPQATISNKSSGSDPTTIVFCTWMGASPRSRSLHAAFHHHHSLFPNARILVIHSVQDWFTTTSTATRLAYLSPTLSVIESDPAGEKRRILVHLFSNGGGVTFHDISTLYKKKFGKVLQVKALVLDSSPGDPTLKEGWAAMKVGFPEGALWYLAAAFVLGWFAVMWIYMRVFRRKSMIDLMRKGLNDWDVMDREARRLYVYGVKDALVGWRGVEAHAEEARGERVNVSMVREEESHHVQHMIKDEKRYWEKVEELWDGTRV